MSLQARNGSRERRSRRIESGPMRTGARSACRRSPGFAAGMLRCMAYRPACLPIASGSSSVMRHGASRVGSFHRRERQPALRGWSGRGWVVIPDTPCPAPIARLSALHVPRQSSSKCVMFCNRALHSVGVCSPTGNDRPSFRCRLAAAAGCSGRMSPCIAARGSYRTQVWVAHIHGFSDGAHTSVRSAWPSDATFAVRELNQLPRDVRPHASCWPQRQGVIQTR